MKKTVFTALVMTALLIFASCAAPDSASVSAPAASAAPQGSAVAEAPGETFYEDTGETDETSDTATAAETYADDTDDYSDATDEPAASMGDKALTKDDLSIEVGGTKYDVCTGAEALKKALGSYTVDDDDATDKSYSYDDGAMTLDTETEAGAEIWYYLTFTGKSKLKTVRGIGIGSSRSDIAAAYGEPYWEENQEDGSTITYVTTARAGDDGDPCVIFDLENDKVTGVQLYAPSDDE